MNSNYSLKLLLLTFAIALTAVFSSLTAQNITMDKDGHVYDDLVNMVVNAMSDNSVSVVLCKRPSEPLPSAIGLRTGTAVKEYYRIMSDLTLINLRVIDKLRIHEDIDSIIFLYWNTVLRSDKILPSFAPGRESEWILFLESPYSDSDSYQASLMYRYEKLDNRLLLNPGNFFTLYEMGSGGLCVDWSDEKMYPPHFIFSKGLVDDFKTIIELQKNPSLLSASSNSYKVYYDSMKDDLGKRVFSRLFDEPEQE